MEPSIKQPENTRGLLDDWARWLGLQTFADPEIEKLIGCCREWAKAFKDGGAPRWLTLLGSCGVGKTHCAKRLFFWANGHTPSAPTAFIPHVIYWPDFVQRLRAGESFAKRDDMKIWPVLLLDDVGAERDASGFAAEELNTLLGCRGMRWTLLTSNLTMKRLEEVDKRLASRVVRGDNILCQVDTEDYALRAK